MRLSTNTDVLAKEFGLQKAVEILIDAGFDAIDFSQFAEEFYSDVHEKSFYTEIRKFVEDKGVYFNQAHAPFHSSFVEEDKTAERFELIVRSMECASILGAKDIVVHPCQHLTYAEKGVPEKLKEINMDFYKRLLPYAEKFNIKIACENMWQTDARYDKIVHSTCASPAEFVDYIDSVGSPYLVACLDIGHTALIEEKLDEMILALGHNRLKALHVHDVDGHHDLHTLPYFAKVDWDVVLGALREIKYSGDFTFEVSRFMVGMPEELYPAALRFMCETGRVMINKIEK